MTHERSNPTDPRLEAALDRLAAADRAAAGPGLEERLLAAVREGRSVRRRRLLLPVAGGALAAAAAVVVSTALLTGGPAPTQPAPEEIALGVEEELDVWLSVLEAEPLAVETPMVEASLADGFWSTEPTFELPEDAL